jgi:hypothetical protein
MGGTRTSRGALRWASRERICIIRRELGAECASLCPCATVPLLCVCYADVISIGPRKTRKRRKTPKGWSRWKWWSVRRNHGHTRDYGTPAAGPERPPLVWRLPVGCRSGSLKLNAGAVYPFTYELFCTFGTVGQFGRSETSFQVISRRFKLSAGSPTPLLPALLPLPSGRLYPIPEQISI